MPSRDAAWIAGMLATFPNLAPWYEESAKPSFNPPSSEFGPIWVSFYVLMVMGAWRVIRSSSQLRSYALILFFTQLALNATWPRMFFAAHSRLLGLWNIDAQLLLVIAATRQFFRADGLAGWCLTPLALRVGLAATLNASIWCYTDKRTSIASPVSRRP